MSGTQHSCGTECQTWTHANLLQVYISRNPESADKAMHDMAQSQATLEAWARDGIPRSHTRFVEAWLQSVHVLYPNGALAPDGEKLVAKIKRKRKYL